MGRLRSEGYLKRRKEKVKQYQLEHREEIKERVNQYRKNPKVKERANQIQREKRQIALEMGLCTSCIKREHRLGKKTCSICAEYYKQYRLGKK